MKLLLVSVSGNRPIAVIRPESTQTAVSNPNRPVASVT